MNSSKAGEKKSFQMCFAFLSACRTCFVGESGQKLNVLLQLLHCVVVVVFVDTAAVAKSRVVFHMNVGTNLKTDSKCGKRLLQCVVQEQS